MTKKIICIFLELCLFLQNVTNTKRLMAQSYRKIPYGMTNFELIRQENYYYVDKTMFIPRMEQGNRFFFFIRPRRFGKSLHVAMLRAYYDIKKKDRFEEIFKGLYIGDHPTEERNKYLVLFINFAQMSGDLDGYVRRMNAICRREFGSFCDEYKELLIPGIKEQVLAEEDAPTMLSSLLKGVEESGRKMYLFIDEYDHFTNSILSDPAGMTNYKAQTHGNGVFRTFYDTIKAGTTTSLARIYITGVSPVTMDDLTSGFNIGSNYTADPRFNGMIGFSEGEVREMLQYYSTQHSFHHSIDDLIEVMKPWYDNYCFAVKCLGDEPLYNSDMVLYFVDQYVSNDSEIPEKLIDDNIRTDYSKIRMLIRKDKEFAHDASVLQKVVTDGGIMAELKTSFPSETVTDPDNFVSLLYYFGMLTLGSQRYGQTWFKIPNQTVRDQIYNYILLTYRDIDLAYEKIEANEPIFNMAIYGDWKPYFAYIAQCLTDYSSHRDKQKGEAYVHGFTLAMACQSKYFIPISEAETGVSRGYADIYLQPLSGIYPFLEHSYILELKYAKGSDPESRVEQLRQQAIEQANRYASSELVQKTKGNTRLHKIIAVWHGMDMAVCEEVE